MLSENSIDIALSGRPRRNENLFQIWPELTFDKILDINDNYLNINIGIFDIWTKLFSQIFQVLIFSLRVSLRIQVSFRTRFRVRFRIRFGLRVRIGFKIAFKVRFRIRFRVRFGVKFRVRLRVSLMVRLRVRSSFRVRSTVSIWVRAKNCERWSTFHLKLLFSSCITILRLKKFRVREISCLTSLGMRDKRLPYFQNSSKKLFHIDSEWLRFTNWKF